MTLCTRAPPLAGCGHVMLGTHVVQGEGKSMRILCIACTVYYQKAFYCWQSPPGYSIEEVKQMTADNSNVVR
jgi:hypothetical protein